LQTKNNLPKKMKIDLWLQQVEHMEQMNRLKWPNRHKKSEIGKKIKKLKETMTENWQFVKLIFILRKPKNKKRIIGNKI